MKRLARRQAKTSKVAKPQTKVCGVFPSIFEGAAFRPAESAALAALLAVLLQGGLLEVGAQELLGCATPPWPGRCGQLLQPTHISDCNCSRTDFVLVQHVINMPQCLGQA